MTASPNSEHLSLVRAFHHAVKSYVTVFAPIAPSMPLMMMAAGQVGIAAASHVARIISPERMTEPGLTWSRLAYLAVPWVASKMAWPEM